MTDDMNLAPANPLTDPQRALRDLVARRWGFADLRPLQLEAMLAARAGRDALVVMPTGGGKSLCYQAPALLADQPTVVVSPLIALMKDQVDSLLARDIPAAFLNSSLDLADKRRVARGIADRQYKLLFVAPERFASEPFLKLLATGGIGAFAIDEAHCISHWGHDFREDYRRLDQLKLRFPAAAVHAFTATATPRVRDDIIAQLKLHDPELLVGDFFRPNLRYRVERRSRDGFEDVEREIARRPGQAGIVYCIRRADVDELAAYLAARGIRAAGYHAGMTDERRTSTQDAFAAGRIDVVVATVAFGMGIDRPDIRFVIHAAMPKSLEHYQQETGRAGRDGQPADCILFYSPADFMKWKNIIDSNEPNFAAQTLHLLSEMNRYCTGLTCRHKALVSYFGQQWTRPSCEACDVCGRDIDPLPDSTVLAQKIMSAVHRTGQRFGAAYVCEVLLGHESERVLARGHHEQSTFALMSAYDKHEVMAWIDQLADQDLLAREGEYRVLKITEKGRQVLRSQAEARLLPVEPLAAPKRRRDSRKTARQAQVGVCAPSAAPNEMGDVARNSPSAPRLPERPLNPEENALFEKLRALRREIADELNVPAFIVFSDKTLRAIARAKPTSESELRAVKGLGPAKYEAFGQRFLATLQNQ